ncbi:MAG TPA: hypothetical protein VGF55_15555 [Gemmataceae bacterium]|jgi:hypothetical protein
MNPNGDTRVEAGAAANGRSPGTDADAGRALVERYHRQVIEQFRGQPLPRPERPTVHYSELPDRAPGSALKREWDCYRREVGRLLAEGHEGRWVLIKGDTIVGIWDTAEEAEAVALAKYFMEPSLTQQIRSREPVVRGPSVLWRCPG